MYRNRIETPDGIIFDFNENELNVPLLTGPHVNNSKNHIAIRSTQYNNLMFVPNNETNKIYKNRTLRSYNLSLPVVRDRIFEQFIENSIHILTPSERPTARANFEIYDKKYRELLQRSKSRTPVPTTYNNTVQVGTKRRRI